MKLYIKPKNRVIDLYEDGELLQGSMQGEDTYEVTDDYAEEALSNKKGIWGNRGIWKD